LKSSPYALVAKMTEFSFPIEAEKHSQVSMSTPPAVNLIW
jgi:hypothetical protein